MDFYNCPYVDIIPFRNGNEYDEIYRCAVTNESCIGSKCNLTPKEMDNKDILTYLTDKDMCDTDEFGRIIIKCDSCAEAGNLLRSIITLINCWIPIENQPNSSGFFVATYILSEDKNSIRRSHELFWDLETEQWYFNEDLRDKVDGNVMAWQPLPKPYSV